MYQAAFRAFCRKRRIPASELTLRYFCAHLSKRVTYQTIKVYLAGIRLLHLEDPTLPATLPYSSGDQAESPRKPGSPLPSLSCTPPSGSCPPSPPVLGCLHAGLLWLPQYSCPTRKKYSGSRHLLLSDITLSTNSLSACLKRSKNDRFATVLIGATGSSICPVRAMRKFLAVRQLQPPGPLFTLSSGDYLTRSDISRTTKDLQASTQDPTVPHRSCHSCSRGRSTRPSNQDARPLAQQCVPDIHPHLT